MKALVVDKEKQKGEEIVFGRVDETCQIYTTTKEGIFP